MFESRQAQPLPELNIKVPLAMSIFDSYVRARANQARARVLSDLLPSYRVAASGWQFGAPARYDAVGQGCGREFALMWDPACTPITHHHLVLLPVWGYICVRTSAKLKTHQTRPRSPSPGCKGNQRGHVQRPFERLLVFPRFKRLKRFNFASFERLFFL